jgi:hypothetical protein
MKCCLLTILTKVWRWMRSNNKGAKRSSIKQILIICWNKLDWSETGLKRYEEIWLVRTFTDSNLNWQETRLVRSFPRYMWLGVSACGFLGAPFSSLIGYRLLLIHTTKTVSNCRGHPTQWWLFMCTNLSLQAVELVFLSSRIQFPIKVIWTELIHIPVNNNVQ